MDARGAVTETTSKFDAEKDVVLAAVPAAAFVTEISETLCANTSSEKTASRRKRAIFPSIPSELWVGLYLPDSIPDFMVLPTIFENDSA